MTERKEVTRARQLVVSAGKASGGLEAAVRELVAMRAWVVLKHKNFSVMWESENGFECPMYVKALAIEAMMAEGMNTNVGGRIKAYGYNGHTEVDIAVAVGMPINENSRGGLRATSTSAIKTQLKNGVPANKVRLSRSSIDANIAKHGTSTARRPLKEITAVTVTFRVSKRDDDAMAKIAIKAKVNKSEIYRQAVAQFLGRPRSL